MEQPNEALLDYVMQTVSAKIAAAVIEGKMEKSDAPGYLRRKRTALATLSPDVLAANILYELDDSAFYSA